MLKIMLPSKNWSPKHRAASANCRTVSDRSIDRAALPRNHSAAAGQGVQQPASAQHTVAAP